MVSNVTFDTEDLWRKDRDHFIHPWTDFSTFKEEGSVVMTDSDGAYVLDSDGNRFLDGIGGLWCVNIGYGNGEMADAIAEQVRRIPYYSTFTNITTPPAAELAAKLAELAKLVDALRSWRSGGNPVEVQVLSSAPVPLLHDRARR